jgi:hypothetical protein
MKRVVLTVVGLVAVGVFASTASVRADEAPRLSFLVDTGWASPENSVFGNTVSVGGGASYRLTNWFGVQVVATYAHFPVSQKAAQANWAQLLGTSYTYSVAGGALSSLTLATELRIALAGDPKGVVPYAIAGGGLSRTAEAASTVSMRYGDLLIDQLDVNALTSVRAMATVGAGFDVPVKRRVRVFAELRYQMLFRSSGRLEHIDLRAGVRLAP